jgi:hypothetical protein
MKRDEIPRGSFDHFGHNEHLFTLKCVKYFEQNYLPLNSTHLLNSA